jgi:ABC-type uncharacterized transport system involved in gliding motility auxiliary subunit
MNSKKELNKRSLWFGFNSAFTVIIAIALIAVLNFLGTQYPQKLDLTKNKIHTFSDQSTKVVKGLNDELKLTFFGDLGSKEKYRPVFDNYKKLSNKIKFELVDPNKEPIRVKSAGIKKMDTLLLEYRGKNSKIEEITEEKITNEIIKLTKDTKRVICSITGHGELSFTDPAPNAFAAAKKGLEDQAYELKELVLPQQTSIPAECSTLIMMGSSKALFPAEVKMLSEYLSNGGRLVVGIDAAISNNDQTKELKALLQTWGVEVKSGLIIDPVSKMLGVDASVPIVAQFNKESSIVKDFTQQCYFPFSRPLELTNPAPLGLKTAWLAKTTPKAWGELNMASIAKGEVQYNQGADLQGPLSTAVSVSGKAKDSKATRDTRIVVFGTSQFANTQYSRFGGNLDLFLNSVSWAVEDESLISIRAKEDQASSVELSQNQGMGIFLACVVVIPLVIAIAGIVIWIRRKKL